MTDIPHPAEEPGGRGRTPAAKFLITLLLALVLAVPLFAVYLLVYDRQSQSETARASIVEGWGAAQTLAGPVLAIPYQEQVTEAVTENGRQVSRINLVWRELSISPQVATIDTGIAPERRQRSIYEAVVYEAQTRGTARFALPADLARYGVTADQLAFDRAELRFGLSDARGLFGAPPQATIGATKLVLQPGKGPGETGGSGFFAWADASALRNGPVTARFSFAFRGNGSLALAPQAGDTRWRVTSAWPHPSFAGGFLPTARRVGATGFDAQWRIGNLALGRALVSAGGAPAEAINSTAGVEAAPAPGDHAARIDLVTPVDLYSEVNRSVKYGFLFIGFTFAAFLMFDVIGGVRVAAPEYLLVGAGLVLFFVLLLALAEVIGFAFAYCVAAAAVIGLLAAYSAAVLGSWRRGGIIAGLLAGLYAVLYVLLSLEAYSLLIGSVLLFAALAAMMYVTRRLDWAGVR
jgi:inner membrane protein